MKPRFTIQQILESKAGHLNQHLKNLQNGAAGTKKTKYNNSKTEVNGIKFDSAKEANRYKDLILLQKAGHIGMLELQVPYELNEDGTFSYKYVADFVYIDTMTGAKIVEDVKGFRTEEYKKKRKLMAKVHGIIIKET